MKSQSNDMMPTTSTSICTKEKTVRRQAEDKQNALCNMRKTSCILKDGGDVWETKIR